MKHNKIYYLIALVTGLSMLLSACQPVAVQAQAAATSTVPAAATATTAPTAANTPTPTVVAGRTGGWLDEIDFSAISDPASAVAQLQAGAIDAYPNQIDKSDVFNTVKSDPNLQYSMQYGGFNQLLLNTVACTDTSLLNPFTDMKMREAMNWAFDRNYVVQEIFGGLAVAKYTVLTTAFPDYARYAPQISQIINEYSYNFAKAQNVVKTEMTAMGATLGTDGMWQYKGKPVTLIGLIRTEDRRKEIGDYFTSQLTKLGFTVNSEYKVAADASPIWQGTPSDCKFNFYTAGWISPAIARDDGSLFGQYSSGDIQNIPLFLQFTPSAAYRAVFTKLENNDFNTMQERDALFAQALTMGMQESWWGLMVNDNITFEPYNKNMTVASDLAAGIASTALWPYTLRFNDKEGGVAKIAQSSILVNPWNPILGSNWTSDKMIQDATMDQAIQFDPYTGLALPQRIASATVVAQQGLPIRKTLDWINLKFVPSITIPDDTWVDWDATTQKFLTVADAAKAKTTMDQVVQYAQTQAKAITFGTFDAKALTTYISDLAAYYAKTDNTQLDLTAALASKDTLDSLAAEITNIAGMQADADKQTEIINFAENFIGQQVTDSTWSLGLRDYSTAKTLSTVVYPSNLYQFKWHDGSNLSVADFVMNMIMVFDPAKPDSKIFDPAEVPGFQSFMSTFKGVRITSTDPLTIETYSDSFALDAELNVTTWYPAAAGSYGFGTAAWHNLTPAIMAEADGKLAFSNDKSQAKSVEWTSLIAGPSLATQKTYLDQALKSAYIPFAPTLGQYITAADATARYTNLENWYTAHGHLWIGTGPYYVDKVFPVEGTISLKRFASYPDPANRWSSFGQPMLATAAVDGPGIVPVGTDATFDVTITFNNKPYLNSDIDTVAYLVFDDQGAVIAQGNATPVADGHYQVTISKDVTAKFVAGSDKLQVVVTSKVVSLPTFVTFQFITQ